MNKQQLYENPDIIAAIRSKFPKNGWSLIRTKQSKPFGYIGYMLTVYSIVSDTAAIYGIRGRNLKSILSQLLK